MIDVAAIEKALVKWLGDATGCTVRLVNQTAPRPAYPYATVKIDGPVPVGVDEVRTEPAGDDVDLTTRGERTVTVQVNVYAQQRGGAYDYTQSALALASKAQSSLYLGEHLATLREAGLALRELGAIQDLTFLQDTAFVERRQFDVRLGLASVTTQRIESIQTADVAGTIGGP